MNADPPDVEFEWSFSSSGERFEVPHGHYTTKYFEGTPHHPESSVHSSNHRRPDDSFKSASSVMYDSAETYGESDGKFL